MCLSIIGGDGVERWRRFFSRLSGAHGLARKFLRSLDSLPPRELKTAPERTIDGWGDELLAYFDTGCVSAERQNVDHAAN